MKSKQAEKLHQAGNGPGIPDLARLVSQCRSKPAFLSGLAEIYEQVEAELADYHCRCMGGGVCCRFDLVEHRLFVSTGELALLTSEPPPAPEACRKMRCPYQLGPKCSARDRRPLGCRIFFCRPDEGNSPQGTYEEYHRRIRSLHQTHWVPYGYAELTSSIMQLSLAEQVTC